MAIEWVVGIGALCALAGFGLGWLVTAGTSRKTTAQAQARAEEVESQLAASRQELEDYRREVFGQFAQTADRFKQLDDSYHALHQQLAASAVALCGEQAGPLLEAPERGAILTGEPAEETVVHAVDAAAQADSSAAPDPATPDDESAPAAAADEAIPTITDAVEDGGAATPGPEQGETVRVAEVDGVPEETAAEAADEDAAGLKRSA